MSAETSTEVPPQDKPPADTATRTDAGPTTPADAQKSNTPTDSPSTQSSTSTPRETETLASSHATDATAQTSSDAHSQHSPQHKLSSGSPTKMDETQQTLIPNGADHSSPRTVNDDSHAHKADSLDPKDTRNQRKNRRKFAVQAGTFYGDHVNSGSGRLVDHYQLGHLMGSGFYGKVFSATDVNDSSTNWAIKELDPRRAPRLCFHRVSEEFKSFQKVVHPNLAGLLDVVREEDHICLIIECVDNGSLMDMMNKFGPLPEPLCAKFVQQILQGLGALHGAHLVHRNLKLSNVLVSKAGDCKITDYGICTAMEHEFGRAFCGSPYSMAPEIISSPLLSPSFDIWAVGHMVIELVTGKPAFSGSSLLDVFIKLTREDQSPTIPAGFDEDLANFLNCCFVRDPSLRKSAHDLLRHPWILKHDSAKKEIGEYLLSTNVTPELAHANSTRTLVVDLFDARDTEANELVRSILESHPKSETPSSYFRFPESSSVPVSNSSAPSDLKTEIAALRALNDANVSRANELLSYFQATLAENGVIAALAKRLSDKVVHNVELTRDANRAASHSNMLLKRTNQIASEALGKNNIIATNVKKLEDYVLGDGGEAGHKKLSTLIFRKVTLETLKECKSASWLAYSTKINAWKKDKEKRGYFVIKGNFLFIFKNDKGGAPPIETLFLGTNGARLAPLSEDQAKRKHCFRIGDHLLVACDTNDQFTEWMLALSKPTRWYEQEYEMPSSPTNSPVVARRTDSTLNNTISPRTGKEDGSSPVVSPTTSAASSAGSLKKKAPQTKQSIVGNPFFGVSFEELYTKAGNKLPHPLVKIFKYLEEDGLGEEGILRQSGALGDINALRDALNHGEDVDFTGRDIHAVAGLLKMFLRDLPEPVVPEPYHSQTLALMGNAEVIDNQRIIELKIILDQLPKPNHELLRVFMRFLNLVAAQSDKNKMTVQNLITCLAPTMKCVPGVFMYAVPNYAFCFDEEDGAGNA